MTLLVAISDTHAGHIGGLMNPDVVLYDENEKGEVVGTTPRPTAIQNYLWELYKGNIEKAIAAAGDDEIAIVHLGDLTQGVRFQSELVTTSIANQILIALANFKPWMDLPNVKRVRLIAGTDVHEFGESSATQLVKTALKAAYPQCDIRAMKHSLLDLGGYLVDISHHGPHPGSRTWLSGNMARYYLKDLIYRESFAGNRPPDLVLRGDVHDSRVEVVDNGNHFSTLAIIPSMCALGNHARKVTRSINQVTHGFFAFKIQNGKMTDLYRWTATIDVRTKEKL